MTRSLPESFTRYGTTAADAARTTPKVAQTVRALVGLSLEAAPGDHLGSEASLMRDLGISRPTLRQASRIVESDHLISVRRGVNGGFYAARPDSRDATVAPALWLRMHGTNMTQMARATRLIFPEIAVAAAACTDETLRSQLRALRDRIANSAETPLTHREIIHEEIDLAEQVLAMAGDPVLALFYRISNSFGRLEPDFRAQGASEDRRREWTATQLALSDAILAGDADVARLHAARRSGLIARWIGEDLP